MASRIFLTIPIFDNFLSSSLNPAPWTNLSCLSKVDFPESDDPSISTLGSRRYFSYSAFSFLRYFSISLFLCCSSALDIRFILSVKKEGRGSRLGRVGQSQKTKVLISKEYRSVLNSLYEIMIIFHIFIESFVILTIS
jgi:hypothetical protein